MNIDDEELEKPTAKKKLLGEHDKGLHEKFHKFHLDDDIINEFRVGQFDKISNLNDEITYKYADFIISKYGFEIQKKKYMFSKPSARGSNEKEKEQVKEGIKKKIQQRKTTNTENHQRIETLLGKTKSKKIYLVDKVDRKLSDK